MSYTIHHLLHINAPKEKVFTALTNIEELKVWYTTEVEGSSALNKIIKFKFGSIDFHTKVIELINNEKNCYGMRRYFITGYWSKN